MNWDDDCVAMTHARPAYQCRGWADYSGHCGAEDCVTCYPACLDYEDDEEEEMEEEVDEEEEETQEA